MSGLRKVCNGIELTFRSVIFSAIALGSKRLKMAPRVLKLSIDCIDRLIYLQGAVTQMATSVVRYIVMILAERWRLKYEARFSPLTMVHHVPLEKFESCIY